MPNPLQIPPIPGLPNIPNPFPDLPPLPFPTPDLNTLSQPMKDVLTALAGMAISPAATATLVAYLAHLENQAKNKLKKITDPLAAWLDPHYSVTIADISYAEDIDTVHGMAITVENHIYFPSAVNLKNKRSHIEWLFHELEHCVQYKTMGGKGPFFAKYAVQSQNSIISNKSFNVHDGLGLEQDAENKKSTLSAIYPWASGLPSTIPPGPGIPPSGPNIPPAPVTLTYSVTVKTRAGIPSGTGATAYITLTGKLKTAPPIFIPPNGPLGRIQPGSSITVTQTLTGLGDLKSITLQHDNTGLSPDWHVESVNVKASNGQQWTIAQNMKLGGGNPTSVTVAV